LVEKRENNFYNITNKWPVEKDIGASYSKISKNSGKNKVPYPFLKWAGGKRQLLNQLIPLFPKRYNKYIMEFE